MQLVQRNETQTALSVIVVKQQPSWILRSGLVKKHFSHSKSWNQSFFLLVYSFNDNLILVFVLIITHSVTL